MVSILSSLAADCPFLTLRLPPYAISKLVSTFVLLYFKDNIKAFEL
jgi:hypothetical protein